MGFFQYWAFFKVLCTLLVLFCHFKPPLHTSQQDSGTFPTTLIFKKAVNCTWSSLLEELVEVQRGGSRVGLLRSGRRGGGLFRFLDGIFKWRAGVRPGGEFRGTPWGYAARPDLRMAGASAVVTSAWFSSSSAGPGREAALRGGGGGWYMSEVCQNLGLLDWI